MFEKSPALGFLRSRLAQAATALLLLEIIAFYSYPTAEHIPQPPPLGIFDRQVGPWTMSQEFELDAETATFLKADDTVSRAYVGPQGPLTLFVGFFKSQRGGVTPHSPKICLPGNGWTPEEARVISVHVGGSRGAIPVNRYIVRRGDNKSLVLYWYATAHHVMAGEYIAKAYLMYEGLRYRRSDEAIFRVIVPVHDDEAAAESQAIRFVQSIYRPLRQQIWGPSAS